MDSRTDYMPTPAQIEAATQEIQAEWGPRERRHRAGETGRPYETPVVSDPGMDRNRFG